MSIPAFLTVLHMEYNEDGLSYPLPGHPGYTYSRCWKCQEPFLHARGVPADAVKDCGSHDCEKAA